jgi:hypothetical protein
MVDTFSCPNRFEMVLTNTDLPLLPLPIRKNTAGLCMEQMDPSGAKGGVPSINPDIGVSGRFFFPRVFIRKLKSRLIAQN